MVTNSQGKSVRAPQEQGYLRLPMRAGVAGEVVVTFLFAPRLEDRRLQRVAVETTVPARHRGVVLCNGPWVLLAAAAEPRPVIVIPADRAGRLLLPKAESDSYALATVASVDATEQKVRAALADGKRLKLAPWQQHPRDKNAAFVFDVIVVPDSE